MNYAPKTFLRQTSKQLIRTCLERTDETITIDWENLQPQNIEPIYECWQGFSEPNRLQIERLFEEVEELACEEGIKSIIDEGHFHGVDLAEELAQHLNFRDKAMYVANTYPEVFRVAGTIYHAHSLSRRYWRHRGNMPKITPDISGATVEKFRDAVSDFFRVNQGRGHRVTVDKYLRAGRYHYFFAYPDNYADTYLGHDDDGTFVRRPQRPTFETIFLFDPIDGHLDVFAQGGKSVQESMQSIFCEILLGQALQPESSCHPYELNVMKSREFLDLMEQTDPEDGIVGIEIRKMRLSLLSGIKQRITLEIDPEGGLQNVYDMMDDCINRSHLPDTLFNVTLAQFHFSFHYSGKGRHKSLTFEVSHPNTSNLKSCKNEDLRLLGEKYLKRWGIDRA
jgi:hypothetical protein